MSYAGRTDDDILQGLMSGARGNIDFQSGGDVIKGTVKESVDAGFTAIQDTGGAILAGSTASAAKRAAESITEKVGGKGGEEGAGEGAGDAGADAGADAGTDIAETSIDAAADAAAAPAAAAAAPAADAAVDAGIEGAGETVLDTDAELTPELAAAGPLGWVAEGAVAIVGLGLMLGGIFGHNHAQKKAASKTTTTAVVDTQVAPATQYFVQQGAGS